MSSGEMKTLNLVKLNRLSKAGGVAVTDSQVSCERSCQNAGFNAALQDQGSTFQGQFGRERIGHKIGRLSKRISILCYED